MKFLQLNVSGKKTAFKTFAGAWTEEKMKRTRRAEWLKMSHTTPQVHIVIAARCGHSRWFHECKSVTDKFVESLMTADHYHRLRGWWHHVPNICREFIFGFEAGWSLIKWLALKSINIFVHKWFASDLATNCCNTSRVSLIKAIIHVFFSIQMSKKLMEAEVDELWCRQKLASLIKYAKLYFGD